MAEQVPVSQATADAVTAKAPEAKLLLGREVKSCRASHAEEDCLDLMLLLADMASGYHSFDEESEGLPPAEDVATDARRILLERNRFADIMVGLEDFAPVDAELLLKMERAAPSILAMDGKATGDLLVAMAQRLYAGGAPQIGMRVMAPTPYNAVDLVQQEHGAKSPEAARALNANAVIMGTSFVSDQTIAQLREAVAIYAAQLGAGSPETAVIRHNLASFLFARGQQREALDLERAAQSTLSQAYGAADMRTITASLALGNMLAEDNDTVQAKAILNSAVQQLAKVAPGSRQLANAYIDLAESQAMGDLQARLALQQQAAQTLESADDLALIGPLRTLLENAEGYPGGIFVTDNDAANAAAGNAQEVARLERIRQTNRSVALADAYVKIAGTLFDLNSYDQSADYAMRAAKLDPYNSLAQAIPAYVEIVRQNPGEQISMTTLNPIQLLVLNYGQGGRALHSDVVTAHLMLGLSGMKSYGPFGAMADWDKAGEIVQRRLVERGSYDSKSRRELDSLRPIFRGQVMVYFATAAQLQN